MVKIDVERVEWVRESLAGSSLDAFVTATPTNVLMLTGYWPVIGKSVAIFTKEGEATLVVPEDEEELAKSTSWASIKPYKAASLDQLVTLAQTLSEPLQACFEDLGLGSAQLGIETGPRLIPASYVSVHVFGDEMKEMIGRLAPETVAVAADDALARLKSRLTQREVEKASLACDIAATAFERGLAQLEPGRTEAEVAAEFMKELSQCAGCKAVNRVGGEMWCMSGPNSAKAYKSFQMSTEREIKEGDFVLIHCNSYADGFWTDITRTFVVGEASKKSLDILAAIRDARAAALKAVKPGICASDVDAAARAVMTQHGFGEAFRHGTGHGVGFVAIDHDAPPRLMPNSPDVIEEGMAFNIEPGAYFEGWGGARHCDMVVCTGEGGQVLSDFCELG